MSLWLAVFGVCWAAEPVSEDLPQQTKIERVKVENPQMWEFRDGLNSQTGAMEPMAIAQSLSDKKDVEQASLGFLSIQCTPTGAIFAVSLPGIVRTRESDDLDLLMRSTRAKVQLANKVWDVRVYPFETLDGWAMQSQDTKKVLEGMFDNPTGLMTLKTPMRKGKKTIQFQPKSMNELLQLPCLGE